MKRIFVPTVSGADWQRLLAKPKLHWKRGASAMTAAAAWEAAADRLPPEVSALLNSANDASLANLELLAALPEWEVSLPGGETTSHTDVLALCRNDSGLCIVAVEAKVNEDFGPLIQEKRINPSTDQAERLKYLETLLGVSFHDKIRYQLLHRTVSALLTGRAFHAHTAVMLVHSFGSRESLKVDFADFCAALKARQVSPGFYCAGSFKQPRLFLGWCHGDDQFTKVELASAL